MAEMGPDLRRGFAGKTRTAHFSGAQRSEKPAGPRFAAWRPRLFLLCRGLRASCRSAAVRVSLGFRMSFGAACNPLPMDVLLDYRIAFLVHLFMNRYFAVI